MFTSLLATSRSRHWLQQNTNVWLRLIMILGVLAASVLVPPRTSERNIAILVGLASTLLFLRWPPLGLLAVVFASLTVPFTIATGTGTSLNATVLLLPLLIGLWALDALARRDLRLFTSRPLVPLLALCVVALLSFVNGNQALLVFAQTAPMPAQLGGLAVFWLSAVAFFLAGLQLRDVQWLKRLTWLFLALGGLYVIGRLTPGLRPTADRIFQSGTTAGSLFWVWLVALAFGQAIYNKGLGLAWRLVMMGLAIATLYVGLFQSRDWISGWLPPVVALMVTLWVGMPRLGFLVTLAGGAVLALDSAGVIDLVAGGDNTYSLFTRLEAWRILEEIIKISPVLGLGPANYYWYTPLFPILGWRVSFSSHNNYIDIVAQTGLLGLACFVWFLWEIGRLGFRLRARVPAGFAQAYACGALGGLAGMLVAAMLADWVLPFVYNIGFSGFRASVLGWIFLGGLVALARPPTDPAEVAGPKNE